MVTNQQPDPARFLSESGLLGEINRRVLHPFGLALGYEDDGTGVAPKMIVLDISANDPEGFAFDDKSLADIRAKFESFMAKDGNARLEARKAALGFIEQPLFP